MAQTKLISIYSQVRESDDSSIRASSPSSSDERTDTATSAHVQLTSSSSSESNSSHQDDDDLNQIAFQCTARSQLYQLPEIEESSSSDFFIINRQHRRSLIRLIPGQSNRSIFFYGNGRYTSQSSRSPSTSGSSSNPTSSSSSSSTSSAATSSSASSVRNMSNNVSNPRSVRNNSLSWFNNLLHRVPACTTRPTSPFESSVDGISSNSLSSSINAETALSHDWKRSLTSSSKKPLSASLFKNRKPCPIKRTSQNIHDYLIARTYGNLVMQQSKVSDNYGLSKLLTNDLWTERTYKLPSMDKIFCSQWLNDNSVIFGTKCNKINVLEIKNGKLFEIPSLASRRNLSKYNENHFIEINPSRTLLATSASNSADIAIYRLPSLRPLCVLEHGHNELIYDACWLDDEFLVTGSDNLVLWHVREQPSRIDPEMGSSLINYRSPRCVKNMEFIQKTRALSFNAYLRQVAVLSVRAQLHLVDVCTLKTKFYCNLRFSNENVCLAEEPNLNLYGIGSKGHVQLYDTRSLLNESTIASINSEFGIRSINFNDHIMSIGSGIGTMSFYDLRNRKYFTNNDNNEVITLNAAFCATLNGPVVREHSPAIYTHKYDQSRTRMFAAGGPLCASMYGNYAAIWN